MNHRRTIGFFLGTLALGSALTLVVQRVRAAGVPATAALTYTGYLESPDGTPVNGSKPVALYIYDAATAGNIMCQVVSGSPTTLTSGRFQILLPETCTAAVKANPDLYVEVQVEGLALGRTKLGAVPYAVEAGHATNADNVRPVSAMRAVSNKAQPLAGSYAANTVVFETVQFDVGSEYSGETGVFTAKEDGYFQVTCEMEVMAPAGTDMGVFIMLNGSSVAMHGLIVAGVAGVPQANALVKLKTGDKLRCDTAISATGLTTVASGERNYFSIARLY